MRNLYLNKQFANPSVLIRYPLSLRFHEYGEKPFFLEEHDLSDNSVCVFERFCLNNLTQYLSESQIRQIASFSDCHLLFIEDFTLPIENTTNHIADLVKRYNFDPKKIWFNIAWKHQRTELLDSLKRLGVEGVNIYIHNCYLAEIYNQYNQNIEFFNELETYDLTKRYSLFTRRYSDERYDFFLKLLTNDLLKDFEYTFTNFSPEVKAYPDPWISKDELKNHIITKEYPNQDVISKWIDGMPYCLDVHDLRQSFPLEIYKRYKSAGINLVIETHMIHRNNDDVQNIMLTEKTYKALISQKPFLLLAPSGSLSLLKKEGFNTFESMFDEKYDDTDDMQEKQNLIIQEIQKLRLLTDAEFYRHVDDLKKITKTNFRRFLYLGKKSVDYSMFYNIGLLKSNSIPKY